MVENVGFLDESHDLLEKSDLGGGLLDEPVVSEPMEYTTVSDSENRLLFKTIDKRGLYYCEVYYALQLGYSSPNDSGTFEIVRNRDGGNRNSTFNYVSQLKNDTRVSVVGLFWCEIGDVIETLCSTNANGLKFAVQSKICCLRDL